MNYAKALPATGGGLLVGGAFVNQAWVLGLAVAVVLASAIAIRFVWRRNKSIDVA